MSIVNELGAATLDNSFDQAAASVRLQFEDAIKEHGTDLFVVNLGGDDLFDIYLNGFEDEAMRQHHNCAACRHFINRFGRLACVNADGEIVPAMWNPETAPMLYRPAFAAMRKAVAKGSVVSVFMTSEADLGYAQTGNDPYGDDDVIRSHFAVQYPASKLYHSQTLTAGQARAAKAQDFITLNTAMRKYDKSYVEQAVSMLKSGSLSRSEKVLGPAEFFLECYEVAERAVGNLKMVSGKNWHGRGRNALWKQVAKAPPGWCAPKSGMLGTLLDDLVAGKSAAAINRSFGVKMDANNYQRAKAAPTAGAIQVAERLVEQMGIQPSLERRFARIEEVLLEWSPRSIEDKSKAKGGVFGHLQAKDAPAPAREVVPAPVAITFDKFMRKVLPDALSMEIYMHHARQAFCGVTTAVHADAPPILQWDSEAKRNPFSWYFYHNGSMPSQWGLKAGSWVKVNGVMLKPSMWYDHKDHYGVGAVFILDGAKDTGNGGLGLFPEIMKSELHQVRSVIEAFSNKGALQGREEASVCGLGVGASGGPTVKVRTKLGVAQYAIDRWD